MKQLIRFSTGEGNALAYESYMRDSSLSTGSVYRRERGLDPRFVALWTDFDAHFDVSTRLILAGFLFAPLAVALVASGRLGNDLARPRRIVAVPARIHQHEGPIRQLTQGRKRMLSRRHRKLLSTLRIDGAGVSALAILAGIVALRSDVDARTKRGLTSLIVVGAAGLLLAAAATRMTNPRRSPNVDETIDSARQLIWLGAGLNTLGSVIVMARFHRKPPVIVAAIGLLLAGDILSAEYLRALKQKVWRA